MSCMVVIFFVLIFMMSDEGEVDGKQQAEDERLHNTGEELDWEEKVSEVEPGHAILCTELIHGDDGFSASINVSVETQAQGDVFHCLRDDFDDKDHESDRDHREGKFWTGEVPEVTNNAVGFHSFELDIADSDEGHSEVETEI